MDISSLLQQKLNDKLAQKESLILNIKNEENDDESILYIRQMQCNSKNDSRLDQFIELKGKDYQFIKCNEIDCKVETLNKLNQQLKQINADITIIENLFASS